MPLDPTNYLYDGMNVLEEVDNSGNVLARYIQGGGIDAPLSELRAGTTSYYQQDGVGSITSLSNSAGTLANTYTYDSYGRLSASTGTLTNPFQYTGREFDAETGIYEYRSRYYDQNTGRFASEDLARFEAGTNFYRYNSNNPVNLVDPFGQAGNPSGPPPPVSVPGGGPGNGWRWNPNLQNSRGGSWGPQTPVQGNPGGSQPPATYEPGQGGNPGHWDVDNGMGTRQRYDDLGNPITPQQAHRPQPQCKPKDPPPWWLPFPIPFRIPGPFPVIFDPCLINPYASYCRNSPSA